MSDEAEPIEPKKKARKRRRGDEAATRATDAPEAPSGVAPRAHDDPRAGSQRWPLLSAAAASVVGLALVGTGPSEAGMWLAIAGGVGLIASIHRLGRLGAA